MNRDDMNNRYFLTVLKRFSHVEMYIYTSV